MCQDFSLRSEVEIGIFTAKPTLQGLHWQPLRSQCLLRKSPDSNLLLGTFQNQPLPLGLLLLIQKHRSEATYRNKSLALQRQACSNVSLLRYCTALLVCMAIQKVADKD